jgi:hypothetical protein
MKSVDPRSRKGVLEKTAGLRGRVREKNHLGCVRDSIRVDMEQPIIIAPGQFCICICVHPLVSNSTSIFIILWSASPLDYSSPSDTRHQTIIVYSALLKHPSWCSRGAQWNIICYGRNRRNGEHVILSAAAAAVLVVVVKMMVRPAHSM